MKKILISLFLIGFVFNSIYAQTENSLLTQNQDIEEYDPYPAKIFSVATNKFWDNWFVQGGINWSMFYSDEENVSNTHLDTSPFKRFRSTPGISIGVGKYFTPGIAVRFKGQGIWGRTVYTDNVDANKNKYFNVQMQPMFNLSNLFYGYKENRIWNLSLFAGAGVNYNNDYDRLAMSYSTGINSTWKISRRCHIYGELGIVMSEHDSDGRSTTVSGDYIRTWRSHDKNIYAETGIQVNVGRVGWQKTPNLDEINALHQAEVDALNIQISDLSSENNRLKKLLDDAKNDTVVKTVKEVVCLPVSVFYELNKTVITNRKQLNHCIDFVEYAKEHNSKIVVIGYADSATGKPSINNPLSEGRAETFAYELVKMGIVRDNITVKYEGGVDIMHPTVLNRRAIAKIVE